MNKTEFSGLALSLSSQSPTETAPHHDLRIDMSSSTSTTISSGWNRLPLECVQVLVDALQTDTGTLTTLLRVNRQLFFLIVPILYRDPFKTLLDLNHRETGSIRVSVEDCPPARGRFAYTTITRSDPFPSAASLISTTAIITTQAELEARINNANNQTKADITAERDAARLKAWVVQDNTRLATIYRIHRRREQSLLATLFASSVQELCLRYPNLKSFYFPLARDKALDHFLRRNYDTEGGALPILDFAEYLGRGIRWTSEEYLRQVRVLDLGRLSTRQSRKNIYERASAGTRSYDLLNHWEQVETWEGKRSTFSRIFSPRHNHRQESSSWAERGFLDFLQKSILVKVCGHGTPVNSSDGGAGAGNEPLSSLRIPAHRLKTYLVQSKQAPRTNPESTSLAYNRSPGTEQSLTKPKSPSLILPESHDFVRPYRFTFDELTRLRRLEVFYLTDSRQNWETLEHVVASLQRGWKPQTRGEQDPGRDPRMIRELSISSHGDDEHGPDLQRILDHFDKLEVLEIQSTASGHYPELWATAKPKSSSSSWWGQHLRTLRVVPCSTMSAMPTLQFLGQFKNLVKLAIAVMPAQAQVFQWIVDQRTAHYRQYQQHQQQQDQRGIMTTTQAIIPFRTDACDKGDCLPHLRQLSLTNSSPELGLRPANSAAEALGDQLQEVVLQMSRIHRSIDPIRLEHQFQNLVRMAIRGSSLENFDFSSLQRCCPVLEKLALLLSHYDLARTTFDCLKMVKGLVLLPRLGCLYMEGRWLMTDPQLLRLVTESTRLYRVAYFNMPMLSLHGVEQADKVLNRRGNSQFPLKPAGLFRRMNIRTSNYDSARYIWDLSFFCHDLDD
ncbi:hypothetical protein BGZ83_001486 [Gryganskiella cystojenkinii]|nr:hypothetical protein BGZ83_001486 [Gryganskiella cystojenkinii]